MDKKQKTKDEEQIQAQDSTEEEGEDSGQARMTEEQEELEKLRADFSNLENQLKRAVADYHNLEKRVAEGRNEMVSWATGDLVRRLLQVVSYYQKALEGASEEERKSGWYKGVEMATQQLLQVLKDEGLDEIEIDGQFDPSLHEAVDTREGEENAILEVVEKGYNLNGKILKPAKVVVGKKGI